MAIIASERPGIYSDYQTSRVVYSSSVGKSVAIVAKSNVEANKLYNITRLSDAQTIFGAEGLMLPLCKVALDNGAGQILAVSVGSSDENYLEAFNLIAGIDNISVVICDSTDVATQRLLMESVCSASENKRERIGIIAAAAGLQDLGEWARGFNCERMLLVAQVPVDANGDALSGCILAAAMAAVINKCNDPAQSFNGTSLDGINRLSYALSEEDVDSFINSGVTPFEVVAGKIEVIRAVSSHTVGADSQPDKTFKEINTILIIDTVIKSVRDMLSSNISAARNNVTTRSAISSQVTVKLQEFLDANIIDSYSAPRVSQSTDDGTLCIVEMDFTVAQGINQIHITANINV